jgi:hypothetical protein
MASAAQPSNNVMEALEASRLEFHAAAAGLSEDQAQRSPGEGRWSVLQCVEHIAVSEGRFLSWLQNPASEPAPAKDKQREARLYAAVSGRATRVEAPPPARPTGQFTTLEGALQHFEAARANSVVFAATQGAGLYSLAVKHPLFGLVNGTELMLLMAAHSRRHAAQIHEIRSSF